MGGKGFAGKEKSQSKKPYLWGRDNTKVVEEYLFR